MANCPKCGKHLRLIDWKQHCPHCGSNIVIYDLQERLMQQADIAEVQHYHFQKKVDNVKGAFVGSKLAVARIFTSILPIAPLFLPIVNLTLKAPFEDFSGDINFLAIYNGIDKLGVLPQLISADATTDSKLFFASVVLFLLSIVITVLHFALNTLACSPKGKIRNTVIDILLLVTSVSSAGLILAMGDTGAAVGTLGIGGWLYILMQLVNTGVDMITLKKGIEIKHAQCYCGGIPIEEYFEMVDKGMSQEEIRAEQYKRLKAIQQEKEEKLMAEEAAKLAEEEKKKEGIENG